MKLVENWRDAASWISVQVLAVLAVAPVVWTQLPQDVKDMVPEGCEPYLIAVIAIGGVVGRLKAQKNA